jgi:hypothetical protein
MHEGPQAGGHGLPILDKRRRIDDHVHALVGLKGLLAGSATQKVERGVVRDAEYPGFGVVDRLGLGEGFQRLEHRLLDDILPIDH